MGGNAVMMMDQNDRSGGVMGYINGGGDFTTFGGRKVTVTKTEFLVIKVSPITASLMAKRGKEWGNGAVEAWRLS